MAAHARRQQLVCGRPGEGCGGSAPRQLPHTQCVLVCRYADGGEPSSPAPTSRAATQVEATTYGAGTDVAGTHTTRTETAYDAYGNVTRQVLHGDIATPADDRNVETAYAYNTTAYILDKPQWQKLSAGTTSGSAGAEQAFSEYLYDDATVVGTPPLKGNLNRTRSYWQAAPELRLRHEQHQL